MTCTLGSLFGNNSTTSPSASVDGVIYGSHISLQLRLRQVRTVRRARVDIQLRLVESKQDGTGSPRCIPPASLFGHTIILLLPRHNRLMRARSLFHRRSCYKIQRPTAGDATASAKCRPATQRTYVMTSTLWTHSTVTSDDSWTGTSRYDEKTATLNIVYKPLVY